MSETHWKRLINPDYLGAYSLDPGKDKILTIKAVKREMITGTGGTQELEDMKAQLTEAQENLREAICALEMMQEAG